MLTLGTKLNRLYTLLLPFNNDFCEIGVIFNRNNTFIGFNIDSKHYNLSRSNQIQSNIFQELGKSAFATTFLDLRDFKNKNLDIKQQFNNIQSQFKDRIVYETNETIKLSKVQINDKTFESCLYIYVLKFVEYGNDLLFCLVERQHIDVALNKKIVRTAAMQLCTNQVHEELVELVTVYNKDCIDKSHSDVDTVIGNIFEEKKNLINNGL